MNNKILYKVKVGAFCVLCASVSPFLSSCEKDLDTYHDDQARLNFNNVANNEKVNTLNYSFVYHGSTTMQDTVWVNVSTMGFLSDSDRQVALKQVATGENDAVPGIDYVPFDDPSLQSFYVVKAKANSVRLPIVVKRTDEMKTTEKTLRVTFADNGVFQPGYETDAYCTIMISDILTKPDAWDSNYLYYYVCTWTRGIHQFLIDQTGDPWDDAFINSVVGDAGYLNYIGGWLPRRLAEVNAERQAQGLGVLMEDDGVTPVVCVPFNPYG